MTKHTRANSAKVVPVVVGVVQGVMEPFAFLTDIDVRAPSIFFFERPFGPDAIFFFRKIITQESIQQVIHSSQESLHSSFVVLNEFLFFIS